MKLKNILITVNDLETSIAFYKNLFGLEVIANNGQAVILTEGLVLQDAKIWQAALEQAMIPKHNSCELYFEDTDAEAFAEKLEHWKEPIQYVTKLTTQSWGQKIIRFYDPDGHLIEVGTP